MAGSGKFVAAAAVVALVFLPACKDSPMDKAKVAVEKGDFTGAIGWYMEALKAKADDKDARAGLSDARLRYAKQFAIDAVRGAHNDPVDWERLIEHLEQEGANVKMELLDAYYNVAEMFRKAGERDKALGVLVKALASDPSRRIPIGKIADLVKQQKDPGWGRKTWESLWNGNTGDQDICVRLARQLGHMDLYDEGIAQFNKCLSLNPGDFVYNNDIRMEISTYEKRKRTAAERKTAQPGAWSGPE
ncbi:MAG: tetratricopeptide repeat protein [Deltaproteobacteria bacterium]|nr:tetratricopeptide repeat protein [Deltaproteobacteria bacterium]